MEPTGLLRFRRNLDSFVRLDCPNETSILIEVLTTDMLFV